MTATFSKTQIYKQDILPPHSPPSSSSVSEPERLSGDNVVYKPAGEGVPDMIYLGTLSNFDLIYAWAQDKCVPLVREITFENGEVSLHRLKDGKFILMLSAFSTSRIGPSLKMIRDVDK